MYDALKAYGVHASREAVVSMLQRADAEGNNDGRVTFDEFQRMTLLLPSTRLRLGYRYFVIQARGWGGVGWGGSIDAFFLFYEPHTLAHTLATTLPAPTRWHAYRRRCNPPPGRIL